MSQHMRIIRFINHSKSWYLYESVPIDKETRQYKKGDIITWRNKNYLVMEDYVYLRVRRFTDQINPFVPLTDQLPH